MDKIEALKKLQKMLDSNLLTEDEFNKMKLELLGDVKPKVENYDESIASKKPQFSKGGKQILFVISIILIGLYTLITALGKSHTNKDSNAYKIGYASAIKYDNDEYNATHEDKWKINISVEGEQLKCEGDLGKNASPQDEEDWYYGWRDGDAYFGTH